MANLSGESFPEVRHDHLIDLTAIVTPPKGTPQTSFHRLNPLNPPVSSQNSSRTTSNPSKKRSRASKHPTSTTAKRSKVEVINLLSSDDEGLFGDTHAQSAVHSAQRPIPAKERRLRAQLDYLHHDQPRQPLKTLNTPNHNAFSKSPNNTASEFPYYKPEPIEAPYHNGWITHNNNTQTAAFAANQGAFANPQAPASAPTVPIPSESTWVHAPNTSATPRPVGIASEGTSPLHGPSVPDTPAIAPITEPSLCPEQRDLKDLIVGGANVFYTGSAGCGKSTVLKAFVSELKNMGKQVDIIAPTGRAALAINGSTTWTYAGWTPDSHKKPLKSLRAAAHGKFVQKRFKVTDVLVIDEISMVENLHFERLNEIMKEARGSKEAFGGVQIVVTGDFCQLPPVKPFQHCITCGKELKANISEQTYKCPQHGEYKDIDKWAFRSKAWDECNFTHVNLSKIHRQSDKVFIDMLQKCRLGEPLRPDDIRLLLDHPCEVENAVKLFSTKEEVRRVNQLNFGRLTSRKYVFPCLDDFKWNSEHRHLEWKSKTAFDGSLLALQDHRFDTRIELKEGMLVVLLVNLSLGEGLVNGSQGVVTGFEPYDPARLPKAVEKGGRQPKEILPNGLVLGGDYAHIKEKMVRSFIESPKVVDKVWPIVTFDNGVVRTIFADCTINELGDEQPYSLLSRTQIPLTAAWAMSIHKSQGVTLNRVTVDLSKSFEEGQMYVALSRARSLEGLKVEGMGRTMGRGNEQVKEFLWEKFKIKC